MDARTCPLDADDLDHAGVQRSDDSRSTHDCDLVATCGNDRYRGDLSRDRTYPFRECQRLEGMTMFKISLRTALLAGLALFIVGCSSSEQTSTPETTASN